MNKLNVNKIGAVALGIGIVAGTVLGAVVYNPEPIMVPYNVTVFEDKIVEVPVEVIKEVEVEKLVEVEVVITDTELIQATCDRLMFDDIGDCQSEVLAEDAALKLALSYVESSDFLDELEDANIVNDEDDVEVIKVYDDFEDINVLKSNYNYDKYKFAYEVKIEDTDAEDKMKVLVTIVVEDGELEFKSVVKV